VLLFVLLLPGPGAGSSFFLQDVVSSAMAVNAINIPDILDLMIFD